MMIASSSITMVESQLLQGDGESTASPLMTRSIGSLGTTAGDFLLPEEVSTFSQLERLMRSQSNSQEVLLMLEVCSAWCGACQSIRLQHQRLLHAVASAPDEGHDEASGHETVHLRRVVIDAAAVVSSVAKEKFAQTLSEDEEATLNTKRKRSQIVFKDATDQFSGQSEKRVLINNTLQLLRLFAGTVQPIFAFFRGGTLMSIVEGVNTAALEKCVAAFSELDVANSTQSTTNFNAIMAKTQAYQHFAAFKLQCCWRRRQQRRRIGVFVDGKFYSHAELEEIELEQQREAEETASNLVKEAHAIVIQRWVRGHLARKLVQEQGPTLRTKAKMAIARKRTKGGSIYHPSHDRKLPSGVIAKLKVLPKAFTCKFAREEGYDRKTTRPAAGSVELLTNDEYKLVCKKYRV